MVEPPQKVILSGVGSFHTMCFLFFTQIFLI